MWCMSFRNRIFLCCYSYFPPSNAFCVDSFDFTESFSMAFLDSMDHAYFLFFEQVLNWQLCLQKKCICFFRCYIQLLVVFGFGNSAQLSHWPTEQDIMYELCTTFVTIMVDRCFILQMGQIQVDSELAVTATRSVGVEMTANAP